MITIYALINPLDNCVFHIGATNNPKRRYKEHCKCYDYNNKSDIILDILEFKMKPDLLILDIVEFEKASFYEDFYTDLFRSFGFILNNPKSNYKGKLLQSH